MKKKKYIIVIVIVILLTLVISAGFIIKDKFVPLYKSNNDTALNFSSDAVYKKSEMDMLQQTILTQPFSLKQFIKKYRPQYIRRTNQGYYAVLPEENNALCFVFWGNNDIIYTVYRTQRFETVDEFKEKIIIGESSAVTLVEGKYDYYGFPISKQIISGHICRDGIIVVYYSNGNVTAESVEIFSNEEMLKAEEYPLMYAPYILEKDRQPQTFR